MHLDFTSADFVSLATAFLRSFPLSPPPPSSSASPCSARKSSRAGPIACAYPWALSGIFGEDVSLIRRSTRNLTTMDTSSKSLLLMSPSELRFVNFKPTLIEEIPSSV